MILNLTTVNSWDCYLDSPLIGFPICRGRAAKHIMIKAVKTVTDNERRSSVNVIIFRFFSWQTEMS